MRISFLIDDGTTRAIAILVGLVLLAGCVDSVNTVENQDKTMSPEFVKNKRVVTDAFLRDRLVIERVDKRELPSGLLQVQVTAKNTRVGWWSALFHGDAPYKIAYRFTWFDKAGITVSTAADTWIEKEVLPGDTLFITTVAPNPKCEDFLLRLREL